MMEQLGTNFNRKGFKDLLQNIENGNINTIITKDVSRLGRNYVKTGYYIEDYFVNKGVRYISILDDIDTYSEVIGNELLPFRAILNDMYSKDISLKQKSSLIERKKRGKYIACYAPYGYKKNKDIIGKLDIDEYSSNVVKRIFELFLNGTGTTSIAKILTSDKVPTPAMYLNMNVDKTSIFYSTWKTNTVRKILRNETYLGYMIQNKEKTISYKNPKRVYLDENEYIKIPNHHEAIISKNDFEKANQILDSNMRKSNVKKEKTILHQFLYCAECNKKLARRDTNNKIYYFCPTRAIFQLCDNSNYLCYYDIEKAVFNYIKGILNKYSNKTLLMESFLSEYEKNKTRLKEYTTIYDTLSKDLLKTNCKLDVLYNDKLNGLITSNMYQKYSVTLKEEQKNIENKMGELSIFIQEEKNNLQSIQCDKNKIDTLIRKFCNFKNVNSDISSEFIEKISIDKHKNFHIDLKFYL